MVAQAITDEQEYRRWAALHPSGYVLNVAGNPATGKAVLHRGDCLHIRDHKKGRLTGKSATKYVAETKVEMTELSQQLGRPAANRWSTCGTCGS